MPANVRALLDELEAIGGPIAFKKQPVGPDYTFRGSVRMDALDASATVYLRNVHDINYRTVLHELWHVRRYWREKVTQVMMMPGQPSGYDVPLNNLHNHFEHLFIVPQEIAYGFSPVRWEKEEREGFAWFRSAAQEVDLEVKLHTRVQIIISYMFCKHVLPALFDEFHATIAAVTKGTLLADLDRIVGDHIWLLMRRAPTLAKLYAATIAGIGGDFLVLYFDIANRTTIQTHVPFGDINGMIRQFRRGIAWEDQIRARISLKSSTFPWQPLPGQAA